MGLDVTLKDADGAELYSANITHNLNAMAEEAGIYRFLWRPEECGIVKAGHLAELLEPGVSRLATQRAHFEKFNAPNGWGTYADLLLFCTGYLQACRDYPNAIVEAWR